MSPGWRQHLEDSLPGHAVLAAAPAVDDLADELSREGSAGDADAVVAVLRRHLAAFAAVRESAADVRQALAAGRRLNQEPAAVRELLQSVPGPGGASGDRRAIRRWLDGEAIEDRLLRRTHDARQRVEILAQVLAHHAPSEGPATTAVVSGLSELASSSDALWTLRKAAIEGLGACIPVAPRVAQQVASLAQRGDLDPWVQAAALEVWAADQPDAAVRQMLVQVLGLVSRPDDRHPDHLFFRARAVALAGRRTFWDLVWDALAPEEDSAHVQLAAVRALATSHDALQHDRLVQILRDLDRHLVVRAGAAVATLREDAPPESRLVLVPAALGQAADVASIVLESLATQLCAELPPEGLARAYAEAWAPVVDRWASDEQAPPDVRVDAAAVRLALRVATDPILRAAWTEVHHFAHSGREGQRQLLSTELSEDGLLDVLALVARDGLDLAAAPRRSGWRVQLGPTPTATPWRLAYELLRPRPDKRQGYNHIVDDMPAGTLLAPSGRVAEVTPTAVPGRPVSAPEQRWWSPDLPLPVWAIAASRRGRLRVRALPDVDMTLTPTSSRPDGWVRSNLRYTRLARTRNECAEVGGPRGRARLDAAFAKAGVSVDRSTPGLLVPAALWPPARDILALDSTTLTQLAVFSGLLGVSWLGSAAVRQWQVRRSRRRVPLVIGGWGSRGKSGTERLKAALFHELGYITVSKTTGNEAMIVVGLPGRDAIELFLYRPYERASIVEQRAVLHVGASLGAQVLLWECMALNPRYVEILQHDWMRDDLTTLTNTYPDHEDIQGPTGHDVAVTIARMLPKRGRALTTEQAMGPVLADRARRLSTELEIVRPETWRLLPPDVVARFPYAEHPRNIALVAQLGHALDVPEDVSWRAMADRLVPDLGVLTEYGPIQLDGRAVSYVVGNSANERAGFLSSWGRMGMNALPDGAGLAEAQVLVVNNRKDRLPRQEVFARVAALDAPADGLVVIGSNVGAFLDSWRGVLRTELRARLEDLVDDRERLAQALSRTLRRPLLDRERAAAVLAHHAPSADGPSAMERVDAAWQAADPALPPPPPAGATDAAAWLAQVAWLQALRSRGDRVAAKAAVKATIDHLETRACGVSDYHASGDTISRLAASLAPLGSRVRTFGAANIKGTGLGLVRRWVQVDHVLGALASLPRGGGAAREGLAMLRTLELAHIDGDLAIAGLDRLTSGKAIQDPDLRGEAVALLEDLRARERSEQQATVAGPLRAMLGQVQANIDVGAVWRRGRSDQLMDDLGKQRVGLRRAAAMARVLVERQRK